jgi:hypothetical protein
MLMVQFLFKLVGSLIFIALSLMICVLAVTSLGLWHGNLFIRFIAVAIIGFGVSFSLFSYGVPRINGAWQGLFPKKYITFICWLISFVFAALGGITYLLMLRNGSFLVHEVVGVVSIYITVATFFGTSSMGVMKAFYRQPML